MKKKTLTSKLKLTKSIISDLNAAELKLAKGGAPITQDCVTYLWHHCLTIDLCY